MCVRPDIFFASLLVNHTECKMTILICDTSSTKPGLLPTPPARYSIGFAGWLPNELGQKPFVATPVRPPPPDGLEARGIVCTERQYLTHGDRTFMISARMQVDGSTVIDCKMKNSFVDFQIGSLSLTRRLSCPGAIDLEVLGRDEPAPPFPPAQVPITTYMIRNIPTRFTSVTFVRLLEDYGFGNKFNFLYIPIDFRSGKNLGYAFINFLDPKDGVAFVHKFHSSRLPVSTSKKILEILPSRRQGFAENIALFRTSDLLSSVSLPHYKPLIATADTGGQLVPLSDTNFSPS